VVVVVVLTTLRAFLSRFYPFTDRVVLNASTGRPKVVCSNTGAEIVEAHAGVALADMNVRDANASVGTIHCRSSATS
jgi:hypothetical protein